MVLDAQKLSEFIYRGSHFKKRPMDQRQLIEYFDTEPSKSAEKIRNIISQIDQKR